MAENELMKPGSTGTYAVMALDGDEVKGLIQANLGPHGVSPFMLERVKIPAGGGRFWSVPTLDGEVPMEAVEGIVIHYRDLRSYWSSRPGDGAGSSSSPPDCVSEDAIVGHGVRWEGDDDVRHDCATCRWAQFGSDPKGGRGQACGIRKAVFLMRRDSILPTLFLLPATSVVEIERFFLKLLSYRVTYFGCVVRLGLEQKQNGTGQAYSRVRPSMARRLDDAERAKVEALRKVLVPALDRTRIPVQDDEEVDR